MNTQRMHLALFQRDTCESTDVVVVTETVPRALTPLSAVATIAGIRFALMSEIVVLSTVWHATVVFVCQMHVRWLRWLYFLVDLLY